jgi:hypothetical protein
MKPCQNGRCEDQHCSYCEEEEEGPPHEEREMTEADWDQVSNAFERSIGV